MSDVVQYDFGKRSRDAARAYGRLVGLMEAQAEAFIGDPVAFFEDASDRIVKWEMLFRSAQRALEPTITKVSDDTPINECRVETMAISKDEYERLRKCAAIVQSALR